MNVQTKTKQFKLSNVLLLPLLLFYYLVVEMGEGVNTFTLLLFHVGFILMYEVWELRSGRGSAAFDADAESIQSFGGFMRAVLKASLGYRILLFGLNAVVIYLFFADQFNQAVLWFMLSTYMMFAILHVGTFQVARTSPMQNKIQQYFYGFLGPFVLGFGFLQANYFPAIEPAIMEKLYLFNCIMPGILPLFLYVVFIWTRKNVEKTESMPVGTID